MNIRKEAQEEIRKHLEKEINETKYLIWENKNEINSLANRQRVLKTKIGELYRLIRALTPKKDTLVTEVK